MGHRLVAPAVSSKEVFVRTYDENDAYIFYRQNVKSDGIFHHGKLEKAITVVGLFLSFHWNYIYFYV